MRTKLLMVISIVLLDVCQAHAASPQCQIKVLQKVKDDLGNFWGPGQKLPVDIARGEGEGGAFCAHGGSCIPRTVAGLQAVRLLNCRIGKSLGNGDSKLVSSGKHD